MQEKFRRMRLYTGPLNGAFDTAAREAVKRFRYRWMLPVSDVVDSTLLERLDQAIQAWPHPRLDELVAQRQGAPTEEDYMRIAESLGIDAATLQAVIDVEAPPVAPAFGSDGKPFILFESHIFSRLTNHQFDSTNPTISSLLWDKSKYRYRS